MIAAVYVVVELFKYSLGGSPLFGLWNPWLLPLFLVPLVGDQGAVEELGFRGWLLPLMQGAFSPAVAAFIVGVFWFLFHYTILWPGFPFTAYYLPNLDHAAASFVQITALSYILTIMFNATGGSVPLVFVAHWLVNVAIKLPAFDGDWAIWSIVLALIAIAVFALGLRYVANECKFTAP
jgi:membrane protease YdiL (CAAX protease family)